MKNVLITGANGFVGQRFSAYLRAQGLHVKGTFRNQTPIPPDIEPIIVSDLCRDQEWFSALKGVDTVFHLAAQAHGVKAGKLNSADYTVQKLWAINVDATQSLAQAALEAGVKRFVYISSIKVNGDSTQQGIPFSPLDQPKPEDLYGDSKQQAEEGLKQITKDSSLELVIVRPPLVYGPGVKGNFLSLLRLCNTVLPLPLAAIQNQRSLIYVENFVSFLYACGNHPQASGQTFLVRDQSDISTPDLIRIIRRYLGRSARLFPCPLGVLRAAARLCGRQEAFNRIVGSLQVDDQLTQQLLEWVPPFSLEEGMKETVAWYKEATK